MSLPIPNLDDKRFAEIVDEPRALIPRFTKEWTDHNVHDPGITFIELFAWLAEIQQYRINQVTERNYQTFFKLIGFTQRPARPANIQITFDLKNVDESIRIDAGTPVVPIGVEESVFQAEETLWLTKTALKSVVTHVGSRIIDQTQANEATDIDFAPLGEEASEDASLLLEFAPHFADEEEQFHLTFVLSEEGLPRPGSHAEEPRRVTPSAELKWEYSLGDGWRPINVKSDTTDHLTRSGRIVFERPDSFRPARASFWLRCRISRGHYEDPPVLQSIRLNTLSAIQVETIVNERLGEGLGAPDQELRVERAPVFEPCEDIAGPGGHFTVGVGNYRDWTTWKRVEDFEKSGPDDRHYILEPNQGVITFGNGLNGHVPKKGDQVRASYELTLGSGGNLAPGRAWKLKGVTGSIRGVNACAASGGEDAETVDESITRAQRSFHERYRAVTAKDYESLALDTPGLRVARAHALSSFHPDFPNVEIAGSVTVVVVPHERDLGSSRRRTRPPEPSEGFKKTVKRHLDAHRLVATEVHVVGPKYEAVSVTCTVFARKRSDPDEVKARVLDAVARFLHPIRGGINGGKGWPLGRPVFPSEVYQWIDDVDGVDYVIGVRINGQDPERKLELPAMGLPYSGEHQIDVVTFEDRKRRGAGLQP